MWWSACPIGSGRLTPIRGGLLGLCRVGKSARGVFAGLIRLVVSPGPGRSPFLIGPLLPLGSGEELRLAAIRGVLTPGILLLLLVTLVR